MTSSQPTELRIVVGIDGSRESRQALRWGGWLAATADAWLEVVGVWQYPAASNWSTSGVPTNWSPEQDMLKVLTDAVNAVFGDQRPTRLRLLPVEGHPVPALLERSQGALAVVVGSRGHGGFGGMLIGAVSAKLAEHASCPVLVVHGDALPTTAAQPATAAPASVS